MRRHAALGISPVRPVDPARFGTGEPMTYAEAFALVQDAKRQFDSLPPLVRDKFRNNPAQLFDFVQDPANREECIKLGLVEPPTSTPLVVTGGSDTKPQTEVPNDPEGGRK